MTGPETSRVDVTVTAHRGRVTAVVTVLVDSFLLLPIGVLAAMVWANFAGISYFRFAHTLRFAINDVGMVFFVGLVTEEALEAVRPGGPLNRWRRRLLPVIAATGGVAGAIVTYVVYLRERSEFMLLEGWPVAAVQDVALAYFIAKAIFLERSGPVGFLLIIAIVSDAIAVAYLALWYPTTSGTWPVAGGLMMLAILVAGGLRRAHVDRIWVYLVTSGLLSWFACYWSGIHPSLALVPVVPFLPHRSRDIGLSATAHAETPRRFRHIFKYTVQAVVLFYGLVNGGVVIGGEMPGVWAVLMAALVGRPAGILLAVGLATAAGLRLPIRLRWRELVVMSLAASSGFASALFVAATIIPAGPLLNELKLGALLTALSAIVAFAAARLLRVGRFERCARPNLLEAHARRSAGASPSSQPSCSALPSIQRDG